MEILEMKAKMTTLVVSLQEVNCEGEGCGATKGPFPISPYQQIDALEKWTPHT